MKKQQVMEQLTEEMQLVDVYMHEVLSATWEYDKAAEIIKTVMSAVGKRYRPQLLLLAGHLGPNYPACRHQLCQTAALIELVHMASLIHDDIVDDSPLRRGQATIQSKFGKDMAVYTGDLMLSRVMQAVFRYHLEQIGPLVSETIEKMCRGEIGQFDSRYCPDTGCDTYMANIYGKTAALFAAACQAGGMIGGCGDVAIHQLKSIGEHLGYLFQIRDDLLDFFSDEQKEGKPIHMDFREGIFTWPVIDAMQTEAAPVIRELTLKAKSGQFSDGDAWQLTEIIRRSGSLYRTQEEIRYHREVMLQLLQMFEGSGMAVAAEKILQKLTIPGEKQWKLWQYCV